MSAAYVLLATLAVLAAAVYAQYRIPLHSTTPRQALIARAVLLAVGIAFGAVMATLYAGAQDGFSLVAFLNGFGLVHVPAAAILFLKRQRSKG